MYPLLDWSNSLLAAAVTLVVGALSVRLYDVAWWRALWFRVPFAATVVILSVGFVVWRAGWWWAGWGVALVWSALPIAAFVVGGLLVALFFRKTVAVLERARRREAKSARAGSRRAFLRRAAAVLPASAGAAGAWAMASDKRPEIVPVRVQVAGLAPELHGLRILQLSDLHLGAGPSSADLKAVLDAFRADPPDLVVLTGDVADKLDELEAGLALVAELTPRLGTYAILGNHEYLNDIDKTLPIYRRSQLNLLINQTAQIQVGDATLFIAGVDDPVFAGEIGPFYERAIAASAGPAPEGAFRLLLCHRPDGFEPACRHGFDLVLSGHTHGAQWGLLGRSMLEVVLGVPYQWGLYRRGRSQLYTTSGFGQWFPFRLNCPAEVPLITLEGVEVVSRDETSARA